MQKKIMTGLVMGAGVTIAIMITDFALAKFPLTAKVPENMRGAVRSGLVTAVATAGILTFTKK